MSTVRERALKVIAKHARWPTAALPGDVQLEDLGLDSLAYILLVLDIESMLARRLFDLDSFAKVRTVDDLLHLVTQPIPAGSSE